MAWIKLVKSTLNENFDSIRFDYLTGEIDKDIAIDRLIEIGEAIDEEDALEIIKDWDLEGLSDDEIDYLNGI